MQEMFTDNYDGAQGTWENPAWETELAQILERADFSQNLPQEAGFAHCFWPLIDDGIQRLQKQGALLEQKYSPFPVELEAFFKTCILDLLGRIKLLVSRTMVLELNVARLQERLHGETAEERFRDFVRQMQIKDNLVPLLEEYPVLARLLILTIDLWVNYMSEFLSHLCEDWQQICETFFPENDPGVLVEAQAGAGDTHCRGRSVIKLKFSSGLKLIYKPRSMALDLHFQELLAWLNVDGDHPPFRVIKLLDKGSYGWSEFVEACSCSSPEQVTRFYERQGAYLMLLYTLEATDFHHENIIAAGEHPILIDLEALFHSRVIGEKAALEKDPSLSVLHRSVLRVGLLPEQIWLNAEDEGVDVSGLNAPGGQQTPYPIPQWQDAMTDQMRLIRQKTEMLAADNRPLLNGKDVDPFEYREYILRGFTGMYRSLILRREALLAGQLAIFASDEIRLILRPTSSYAEILFEGTHPDLMRDPLELERFFDHLAKPVEVAPHLARVISYEREDLHNRDIPMFHTTPCSHAIITSQGEILEDFLHEPGLVAVKERVEKLDERDLQRQTWLIQASLATIAMGNPHATFKSSALKPASTEASSERLLAVACAIGDRIGELALRDAERVSWVGLSLLNERRWALLPVGLDLYGGSSGIIFFLSYLGSFMHDERYTTLARQAFSSQRGQLEQMNKTLNHIGAFSGQGSRIYLLAHLGSLWRETGLWDEAEEVVDLLPELLEEDQTRDIISGAAGCLLTLLCLYRVRPSAKVREAAILCGDRLLAQSLAMPSGIAWETLKERKQPLTGFSHGAAGIGFSLLALFGLTGEERFRQAALAAMSYERSTFSPERRNWPDFRDLKHTAAAQQEMENATSYMAAWCHGAAGIGLARLASLQYLNEPEIYEEIQAALATTIAQGFGSNHSLCHGDLGNLETLLLASQVLRDPYYVEQLKCFTAMILESIDSQGWLTGIPLGLETPGLMTGLAGIGYQCLRLAEPEKVPSVLLLAPPVL